MATTDKAKNTAQQAKGKLKETAGKVSGNDKLRAEGKADRDQGQRQAGRREARKRFENNAFAGSTLTRHGSVAASEGGLGTKLHAAWEELTCGSWPA